jgi:hypothetical protein
MGNIHLWRWPTKSALTTQSGSGQLVKLPFYH